MTVTEHARATTTIRNWQAWKWMRVLRMDLCNTKQSPHLLRVLDMVTSPTLVYGEKEPMYSMSLAGNEVFEISMGWLRHVCPVAYAEACAAVLRGDLQLMETCTLNFGVTLL